MLNLPTLSPEQLKTLPREQMEDLLRDVLEIKEVLSRRQLNRYQPYPKQMAFHAAGARHRERLLMAGNQLGKTYAGGAECAYHLTGKYPEWWEGRRFDHPVRAWAGSKGSEATRDGIQRILVGEPKDKAVWGTGLIPGDDITDTSLRQGLADSIDSVLVKHATGGNSTLGFKSYDQGRERWQGETLDFVWFDEEPDMAIYMEGLTRTNATGGMVYMTFTPLLGMSDVVMMFLKECGIGWPRSGEQYGSNPFLPRQVHSWQWGQGLTAGKDRHLAPSLFPGSSSRRPRSSPLINP
jgi:phage terminase large subunit-like protein